MKVEEKVRVYLDKIKKENERINAFIEVRPEKEVIAEAKALDSKKKKGKLHGYVFGIKSNINVSGLSCSCASRVLEDYRGSYDASVVKKIRAEDGLIIGMLNMDEFASGTSGETSAFGPAENPVVSGHIPGGSSSGSAAAVAAGFCDVTLGSDTGGSIRVPSSFCGVVGMKPSYGAVSRYGLIDLSMSLDQIGPLGRSVSDVEKVFEVIKGKDDRDAKSVDFSSELDKRKLKIGVVRLEGVDSKIQKHIDDRVEEIKKKFNWSSEDVEIEGVELSLQAYHVLVWTEFFSSTRRFDGRKYGKKIEDYCGKEVLRRILGGSEISKAEFSGRYYYKAVGLKELIGREFDRVFRKVDFVVMPSVPVFPWKLGSKVSLEELYAVDALAIPANLGGVCAISIPCGTIGDKPVGMQLVCGKGEDNKLLSIAKEVERLF